MDRLLDAAMLEVADAVLAAHPVAQEEIRAARRADAELRRAFADHWGVGLDGGSGGAGAGAGGASLPEWTRRTFAMASEILGSRVPLRSAKRMEVRRQVAAEVTALLAQRVPLEIRTVERLFDAYRAQVAAVAAAVLERHREPVFQAAAGLRLPPGINGLDDVRLASELPVPGIGPLAVRAGMLHRPHGVVRLGNVTPGPYSSSGPTVDVPLDLPSVPVPLVLDLDRDGGLVTDSAETVTSVLLRLLALLLPGQVRAHVFDPQALGESVKALFGLGDAATKIIGAKVRTDGRELTDLLAEVEEHLTFVTQKYLGGTYESLTAYNAAAGEVAEPYRLLLLFDFPKGFVRADGSHDAEALDRLGKIVQAGPRCGVFTFVVSSQLARSVPTSAETNTALAAGQAGASSAAPSDPVGVPVRTLPHLFIGRPVVLPTARRLTGLPDSALRQTWPLRASGGGQREPVESLADGGRPFAHMAAAGTMYLPEPPPAAGVLPALLAHVERGLATADDVRVDADDLHRLATAHLQRAVAKGVRDPEVLPDPGDPGTWWQGDSTHGLRALFGRVGAADVGELVFDSEAPSALLGGRPGAGKSVLLHAVIGALTRRYGPDQLELYLVDLREGVEFQVYAAGGLPHARVVAVESDREFALSVLRSIDAEIARRGQLLRGTGGEQVELAGYRERTGLPMPRVLVVIDEFHVLFNTDDKIAGEAAQLLDRIIRQGRGFGVHALLASQTLAGMVALGSHTLRQVPVRIALQSDEADSRIILGEDNPDARLLSRSGEGILNRRGGLKDANERFQAGFSSSTEREELVADLRDLADRAGWLRRPTVFEGRKAATVDDEVTPSVRDLAGPAVLSCPVGLPMTLGGPVAAELRREPGGNLLVVADEPLAQPLLTLAVAGARAGRLRTHVVDFAPMGSAWEATLDRLAGGTVSVTQRRGAGEKLKEVADLVAQRLALSDHRSPAELLVLAGLHRAREFDPTGYGGAESELLEQVLRDGPDVGVHVIAWCDKPVSVERRLSGTAFREFGVRVVGQMSRDDSFRLVDGDVAATLSGEQLVMDDHDRSVTHRVRAFAEPSAEWLTEVLGA